MTRKVRVGTLQLMCAVTGQPVNTGVRFQQAALNRVARAQLRMRCPHCRSAHLFAFAQARLSMRLNGLGIADTPAGRTGRHPPRFRDAVWRAEPGSRN